jgi:hypothetical protein
MLRSYLILSLMLISTEYFDIVKLRLSKKLLDIRLHLLQFCS